MEYRNLGRAGAKVSTLCLGAMTFGEADEGSFMHQVGADEQTAFALMDRALDAGVNFWDTADVYGQDGLSERVVGRWFTERQRRDEVVLATKFRFRMGEGPNGTGASRRRVVRCVRGPACGGCDRPHRPVPDPMQDGDVREEELLRALDDLGVRPGKVLYVGCSNYRRTA
ncbi:MAG: aldo/keto reductase [Myxococcota bacterium]